MQRLDLLAAANPRSTNRWIWFTGLFALWSLLRVVLAIAGGAWGVAAIASVTTLISSALWFAARRAKRRIPDTTRWLDGLAEP
jgi:hypothetical protein